MWCPNLETLFAYTIILVIIVSVLVAAAQSSEMMGFARLIAGAGGLVYLVLLGAFVISNSGLAVCERPSLGTVPGSVAAQAVTTV